MMKKVKSFICMMLCSLVLLTISTFAINIEYAPQTRGVGINSCTNTFELDTSTGLATCEASTRGTSGVTRTEVSMSIQRRENGKWVDVSGTYKKGTSDISYVSIEKQSYLEKNNYYRLESYHVAYIGSTKYTDTVHSEMKFYN